MFYTITLDYTILICFLDYNFIYKPLFLKKKMALLNKWNDFIASWAEAVKEGYSTPVTFVKGARIKGIRAEFADRTYDFVRATSPGYDMRKELMDKQKQDAERRKQEGLGPRWKNDGSSCFLCDNIGQAIAAKTNKDIPNNAMHETNGYFILPNKYPSFIGHSLFVPKEHDNEEQRVIPENGSYHLEQGKTRGALVTPEFLEEIVRACQDSNLVGIRNHVLDGMSIPGHDHFHLYPQDLESFSLTDTILDGMQQTDYGKGIYTSQNTPFDMLVFSRQLIKDDFYEKTSDLLGKIETASQVFTLLYTDDNLIVSPRKNSERITTNLKVGGGLTFHSLDSDTEEYFEKIREWVPMRGEFNWDGYF